MQNLLEPQSEHFHTSFYIFLPVIFGSGSTIRIWNLITKTSISTLSGHLGDVLSLKVLNSDGSLLASGSADKNVFIWNLISYTKIRQLTG